MWLLDENLPVKLHQYLANRNIKAESTQYRGWKGMSNGALVSAASAAGFTCILTLDQAFAEAAARALSGTQMSVVLVRFSGHSQGRLMDWFEEQFDLSPIKPISGQLTEWPE